MAVGTDTLINALFDGRYRIIRKLGHGGMANVYLAEDQELGRRVAIKILNDRHAGDEQFVERFRREAKNAAGLSHGNIVSIYDRGEAQGTYYIAMEFLDGRSLKELILSRGPAPISVAIDYVRQILAALRFAHKNGIVHRDIKPHNVLVDSEGRIKVTDFGIARAGTSQMTEAGSIIGTAQYLSPEQAKGAPVDQTSDLYSLGVVLYELLTGTVPFNGDTPVEIAMKHLSATPRPPSELRPDIPPDLDWIVLRALGKSPAERYQDAEEMDADLARVQRGVSVSPETEEAATQILSRPSGPITTPTSIAPSRQPPYAPPPVYYDYDEPPARRRPFWPWLLAVLLVALALVGGYLAFKQIQHQLNANKPVAVDDYIGLRESLARDKIKAAGLQPKIERQPSTLQPPTFVYDQDPAAGNHVAKGNTVTIFVSTGKPKTTVPDVRGRSSADAVGALRDAKLIPKVVEIHSGKPADTVTAQSPLPGKQIAEGSTVRINVSQGPQPVTVPAVVGEAYVQANSELQGAGFLVARHDQDSTEPAETVLAQSPVAGSQAARGSTVTVTVSKGPKSVRVPDVSNQSQADARAALEASGFHVSIEKTTTQDPNQDGFVLGQSPVGGTAAKPGTTVTITVGSYTPPAGGGGTTPVGPGTPTTTVPRVP